MDRWTDGVRQCRQGVGKPLEGHEKLKSAGRCHADLFPGTDPMAFAFWTCPADDSPGTEVLLSLVVGNYFIRSSPASLCFPLCVDGSIIKCKASAFSVFLPHPLGSLDVP